MKSKLLLLIVWLRFFAFSAIAQTTVQIGNGAYTGVPNTLYSPIYRFSETSSTTNARSNILFTQDELSAVGILPGAVISAVAFNKLYNPTFLIPVTFSMYLANTSNTALSNTTTWASVLSTHTQVFTSNAFTLPATAGWVSWPLTSFTYTGGSLELATDLVMTGGASGANGLITWEYTPGIPADKIIGATGSSAPATLNGTGGTGGVYLHRPNIQITFTQSPLPLTFLSFDAIRKGSDAWLAWSVSGSVSCSYYEVQRSVNGGSFAGIHRVNAVQLNGGQPNYSWLHENALQNSSAKMAYRIAAVSADGSASYSKVVTVKSISANNMIVSPNPFVNEVCLKVYAAKAEHTTFELFNAQGIKVHVHQAMLHPGQNSLVLAGLAHLPAGAYFVRAIINGSLQAACLLH